MADAVCAICCTPAVYTCPRCAIKSCSLACSKLHKSSSGCSGERDAATYVPMNKYSWGTMMNDYTYLEQMSRKVSDWGRDIQDKGMSQPSTAQTVGRRGRGRGRGRGGIANSRSRLSKRDLLRSHLQSQDIDMELLPEGMSRRNLNRSSYNPKSKVAYLTIEFLFHPPSDINTDPFSYLLNGAELDHSFTTIMKALSQSLRPANSWPAWATDFLPSSDADHFQDKIVALEVYNSETVLPASSRKRYRRLLVSESLASNLKGHSFIEFPTISIWHETVFDGILCDSNDISIDRRVVKKPRIVPPPKTVSALVDGYGSTDEDDPKESANGLVIGYQSDESEGFCMNDDLDPSNVQEEEGEWRDDLSDNESVKGEEVDAMAQRIVEERRTISASGLDS